MNVATRKIGARPIWPCILECSQKVVTSIPCFSMPIQGSSSATRIHPRPLLESELFGLLKLQSRNHCLCTESGQQEKSHPILETGIMYLPLSYPPPIGQMRSAHQTDGSGLYSGASPKSWPSQTFLLIPRPKNHGGYGLVQIRGMLEATQLPA